MVLSTFSGPAFESYVVYSAILAVKMLLMSPLTVKQRITKKVFANVEDAKRGGRVKYDDPDVERVRRAHRNDLENIPAFWILGALYLTTGPVAAWATLLFRVYAGARILHSIVYCVIPMPQPSRAIAFLVPLTIKFYMGAQVVMYYITAL